MVVRGGMASPRAGLGFRAGGRVDLGGGGTEVSAGFWAVGGRDGG